MEKKDILFTVVLFALAAFSLYRRYVKSKQGKAGNTSGKTAEKSGLSSQPDDYEPYVKKKP